MTQKPRILRSVLTAVGLSWFVACGALRWEWRELVYPGMGGDAPAPAPSGIEKLLTRASDGTQGYGLYVEPSDTAPIVVFWHGNGDRARDLLGLAQSLRDRNIATLLAEYRGYGGIPGLPDEAGLTADADALLTTLAARAPGRPVIFMGQSLGTGVAAAVAAHPTRWAVLQAHGMDVRGLVLVSPYTSLPDVGARQYPIFPVRLLLPDVYDTLSVAATIALPTVVFHGEADELIPFDFGKQVAAAIPGARLVPVPGAGHEVFWTHLDAVLDEVQRMLGPKAAGKPVPVE